MTALSSVITSVLRSRQSFPVIPFDFWSHALHASSPLPAHPGAILGQDKKGLIQLLGHASPPCNFSVCLPISPG